MFFFSNFVPLQFISSWSQLCANCTHFDVWWEVAFPAQIWSHHQICLCTLVAFIIEHLEQGETAGRGDLLMNTISSHLPGHYDLYHHSLLQTHFLTSVETTNVFCNYILCLGPTCHGRSRPRHTAQISHICTIRVYKIDHKSKCIGISGQAIISSLPPSPLSY